MFKLLTRLFIKNSADVTNPAVRRAYGTLCSVYGIALNLLLFVGKYLVGIAAHSVAITADAFNNLSDAGSSIVTLLGFVLAGKKPDPNHPFGHGRLEYLSGLTVSLLIMLMGFELGKSSFERILEPTPVEFSPALAIVLAASIAVKLYMYAYNSSTGKKINSAAMAATAADSRSDSIATAVVLLSMIISAVFKVQIDGYIGMLVALLILKAGYDAAKDTLSPLLGQAPDPELVKEIMETVMAHREIAGIHDMIVHDYGPGRIYVSLHAEVDGRGDIFELHDAIDLAETDINSKFNIIATIHMDPIDTSNPEVLRMRKEIAEKLTQLHPDVTIHDFRAVPGPTHTNVIFDAVFPHGFMEDDKALKDEIQALISADMPNCYAKVNIDRSHVL